MPSSENAVCKFTGMEQHQHRFYCHIESNGTWGVWDRVIDMPARLGGGDLKGCTSQRAETAQGVLRRIYSGGLEAIAVRVSGLTA